MNFERDYTKFLMIKLQNLIKIFDKNTSEENKRIYDNPTTILEE